MLRPFPYAAVGGCHVVVARRIVYCVTPLIQKYQPQKNRNSACFVFLSATVIRNEVNLCASPEPLQCADFLRTFRFGIFGSAARSVHNSVLSQFYLNLFRLK